MPKLTHKIETFHGGINSDSDPRDLQPNQSPSLYDANIDKVGRITTLGAVSTTTSTESASGTQILDNYGLFAMNSDRQLDNGSGDETILFIYDTFAGGGSTRYINAKDSEGWDANKITFAGDIIPVYYSADGILRISDASFSQDSRWFGYINYQTFNGYRGDLWSGSDPGWVDTEQSPTPPTKGKCLISNMTVGDDTTGVLSPSSEYIDDGGSGFLSGEGIDKVLEHSALNARIGFQINSKGGLIASSYDIIASSTASLTEPDVDATDAAGAPFKLLGGLATSSASDHSVYVPGSTGTAASKIEINTVAPILPSDSLSSCFGFYIEDDANGYQAGNNIEYIIRMGSDDSNYYEWLVSHDEIVPDCWNILVCEIGNFSSTTGSPPDLDGTTAAYHVIIMDKNTASGDAPDFWTGGFFSVESVVDGYNPGTYTFHYTWLYDESKQESLPFEFKGVQDSATAANIKNVNKIVLHKGSLLFKYDFYMLPLSANDTYGINKRITGARTYWKVEENDNYYLIGELDFIDNGFKWVPEGDSMDISIANTADNSGILDAGGAMIVKQVTPESANIVDTFKNINGFSTEVKSIDAKYKTAVLQGRRVYVGNVEQSGKTHPDRILKSQVNRFDTFPEGMGNVDVVIRDGENIVKLEAFADRILQYKENSLYIINVSETMDFLEDTYRNKGCAYPYHTIRTDYGIAWFNTYGVYFYDGKGVTDLLEKNGIKVINEDDWHTFLKSAFTNVCSWNADPTITNTDVNGLIKAGLAVSGDDDIPSGSTVLSITSDTVFELSDTAEQDHSSAAVALTFTDENAEHCHIGYIPRKRQLLIKNLSGDIFIYDFVLQSWMRGTSKMSMVRSVSNFGLDENQDLFYFHASSTSFASVALIKHEAWSPTAASSANFEYKTPDIDFGEPGVRKKIYKAYVTYKSGNATTNVQVDYDVNGGTTFPYDFETTELPAADGWQIAELKPDVSSESNNIKSFQLRFATDGTVPSGFEINDITIIYRMKNIK